MSTVSTSTSTMEDEDLDAAFKDLNLEVEPLPSEGAEGDGEDMSFHSIYKYITANKEAILIIRKEDEQKLRRGLSAVKAKHASKLKDNGLPVPAKVLDFVVHTRTDNSTLPEDQIKIQISLKDAQSSVRVHKLIKPQPL